MSKTKMTYKQKLMALAGAVLFLLLCSYHFSLKKTLLLRSEYRALQQKAGGVEALKSDIQKWQSLNAGIDRKLGGDNVILGFQENLLGTVGSFCADHSLVLVEFSEPFEGSEEGYRIETIILKIKGGFKPLLELVHHLEENFSGGRLASVEFVKEKNFKSNREELFLKLYVQKVKRDENKAN